MKDLVPQIAVMEKTLQNINETLKKINSRFDRVDEQIEHLRLEIKADMDDMRSDLKTDNRKLMIGASFFTSLLFMATAMKWMGL